MADKKSSPKFVVGERVLCFEPNPAKARVLYDAKILDVDFVKDGKFRRENEYKVHFQGWNSAWDRWADESFVLKNNEVNKKLQRKLAKKAIRKMKSHGKKRVYLPGVSSSKLDQESSDSDDVSARPNLFEEFCDSDTTAQKRVRRKDPSPNQDVEGHDPSSPQRPPLVDNVQGRKPPQVENVQGRKPPLVEIPFSLQQRLEEDAALINKRGMLVELPSQLSVVQILENFSKHFALNIARLPSSEKTTNDIPPPEKSVRLCWEVCEELRILFDFTLPILLLYNCERGQHSTTITHCYITNNCTLKAEDGEPPEVNPAKRIKEDIPEDTTEKHSIGQEEQKPHHRLTAEERTIAETHTYLIPDQPNLDRTGLANDAQGRRRSSRLSHNLQPDALVSPPVSPLTTCDVTEVLTPLTTCDVTEVLTPVSMATKIFLRSPPGHIHGRVEDVHFLCSSHDRFSCDSTYVTPEQICLQSYLGRVGDDVRKAMHLSEAWKFRLMPENYRPPDGASVPCSLIYGIQHFLRLFVKLPEVFSMMEIPDDKLKVILKHLQHLLKFVADYEHEIFSQSNSYVTNEL